MSQLNCGTLKKISDKAEANVHFRGSIALGTRVIGALALSVPSRKSASEDAPDYDVSLKPTGGEAHVVGAAWIKNTAKVGDFLTLTLDDPDWPREVFVTAFPSETKGEFRIVWSRPRVAQQQREAA